MIAWLCASAIEICVPTHVEYLKLVRFIQLFAYKVLLQTRRKYITIQIQADLIAVPQTLLVKCRHVYSEFSCLREHGLPRESNPNDTMPQNQCNVSYSTVLSPAF